LHAIQKHKFFHIFKSPFFSNSLKRNIFRDFV